jgi:Tol biopolymer transport system component
VAIALVALLAAGILLVALWYAGRDQALERNRIVITDVATGQTTPWRSDPTRDLWAPAWSPDGAFIAWHETSAADAAADLFVAAVDGSDPRRITSGSHAAWSPDGRRLAFEFEHEPGDWDIYVIDVDGQGVARITDEPGLNWAPAWSPDGQTIAFTSRQTGEDQIHVVGIHGGAESRALTTGPGSSVYAKWSPDGSQIGFGSDRTNDAEVYVADAEGSDPIALTDNDTPDWDPVWSPDGRRIVFLSYRDGEPELYIMNVDGSDETNLTRDPTTEESGGFSWSPDGSRVIHAIGPSR